MLTPIIANIFPDAEITGTDLSPVQPTHVPPNVHFLIDDANETDWLWPEDHFDYIHLSILFGSFERYGHLLDMAYKYLKPGGYIECAEYDLTLRCDDGSLAPPDKNFKSSNAFRNWLDLILYATSSVMQPPRPLLVATEIPNWMRNAGFTDVREHVNKVPVCAWSRDPRLKKIGVYNQRNWLDGLQGFSYVSFGDRGLGWTQEEIEVFLVDVRKALLDKNVHAYNNFHVIVGKKPEQ